MVAWGRAYAARVQPVKPALREVLAASNVQETRMRLESCGRFKKTVGRLKESLVGEVPDYTVELAFRRLLSRLDRVGEACALKSAESLRLAVEDLDVAFADLRSSLRTYGIAP